MVRDRVKVTAQVGIDHFAKAPIQQPVCRLDGIMSDSCRVGYPPPTGVMRPFHGARETEARLLEAAESAGDVIMPPDPNSRLHPD
jgi:hypothetical protein